MLPLPTRLLPRAVHAPTAEHIARLDPERDFVEISRLLSTLEFAWDVNQALSFALFRTYAVPSIGRLLDETQEFGARVQQRYDDTALLLEAPLLHGFDSDEGRTGVRRINQMHRRYDISNDDMRYVLSTFVVVPKRWMDRFGWRPFSDREVWATTRYYRELGRHMGIREVPTTYAGFERLMDAYERDHFAFDEGGRRVADSTMALMATFHPGVPDGVLHVFARSLMEPHLLAAFRYDEPGPTARAVTTAALRARSRALRLLPSGRTPTHVADLPQVRSYPHGYDLARLGTFAPGQEPAGARGPGVGAGCPVAH